MFSPRWDKKCSAVWDGRSFCCTMGTSVCSIVTDAKAACGDLVTLCGWTCISLIYLHLEVCFCRFGSEAASVQHRLTGKWIALKEVAISKQCLIVGFFALFLRIHTGLLQKRRLPSGRFLFPEASRIKPTSPDENTARLQVLVYSGKTIMINSKKEVDLKLSFTLKSQSEVFALQLPELAAANKQSCQE